MKTPQRHVFLGRHYAGWPDARSLADFSFLSGYGHELDSNSRGNGEIPNGPHRLLLSRDQASLELCP